MNTRYMYTHPPVPSLSMTLCVHVLIYTIITCTCKDDRDGWFGRRLMKVHVHVAIWYMEAKYMITTIQL